MEIEVTHISANEGRIGPTYLRIHIGSIHINQSTIIVHSSDHFTNSLLEYTMRGRIGNHTAGQNIFVLFRFCFPIRQVGVALFIAFYDTGCKAGLHTRSRVRTVSRSRDKKHFTLGLSQTLQVLADHYKARIFTSRTGCRLQGASIKTGDSTQLTLEFFQNIKVSGHLLFRRQRMYVHSPTESDRDHSRRRIEFHRTAAQRDHRGS